MAKKNFYAVAVGRKPGIYSQWFGKNGAHVQVDGYRGARYKGFFTIEEARTFMNDLSSSDRRKTGVRRKKSRSPKPKSASQPLAPDLDRIIIYTDGSSLGNPGPGGYGVVIAFPEGNRELSMGYRHTTNNRMELLACIVGLEQLKEPSAASLYSDSRYVVDGITKGWAIKWRQNHWKKSTGQKALNTDLWERLLDLCDFHDVQFIWVKGHAGNPGNERCDALATQAAAGGDLQVDEGYFTKHVAIRN